MTLRLIFLFGWLTLLAPRVLGQPTTITDNSLNRVPADWKGISTENFDLFFPGTSPVMGTIAAQYAEECFFHFTTLMDFRPRHRYSIFLFNDPLAYTESALIKAEQIREPGQTILFDYSFSVLHPGDNAGFYKSIRTQVARLVMGDYYHGGSIQYSIQSNTLLYLPAWYSKGLTAYFGEGWGPQDEMIIGGLKNENLLELALEGDSETEYVIRKSIWHFIVTAYGPEKFSELFYMTRLTRSIESGLITVLGITPKTLTERWREWLLQEVNSAAEGRMELPATIDFKGIRTGEKVRGYAFDRQGKQLALFVSKQGKQRLLLVDIANGNSSELFSINGPADPVQDLVSIKQPLVFSPDGKKIAGVLYKKAKAQFFYIETEGKKKNVASSPVSPSLELVNSISWSNDGKDLVISGLKNGNCNLYLAKAGSWNLVQLTKNGFDELSPVFSSDDQNIYFSSNRDTSTADNLSSAWECRNKYFNIFKIATRGTNSPIERVSVTPLTNEFPVAFTSSFELVCISDESGLRNLVKRNVFLGSAKNISDFRCGMDQAMINDSILLFGVSTKNSTVFYKMAAEKIPLSLWVKNTHVRDLANANQTFNRTIPVNKTTPPAPKPKPAAETTSLPEDQPKDTIPTETKQVKFYVFDEDDMQEAKTKKKTLRVKKEEDIQEEKIHVDFSTVKIGPLKTRPGSWTSEAVTTKFRFSPPWFGKNYGIKPAFEAGMKFRNLQNDRHLSVSFLTYLFDFRSNDFQFKYSATKKRIDFHFYLQKSFRYLKNDDFMVRFGSWTPGVTAEYPLSRSASVSASLYGSYMNRVDMNTLEPQGLDKKEIVSGIKLNYHFDNLKKSQNFNWKGTFFNLNIENVGSISQKEFQFFSATADLRKYTRILRNFVLATQVQAGWSLGNNRQEFFLGGVDGVMLSSMQNGQNLPLNANSLSTFRFMEFVGPMRGFQYNARNGTQYVTASAELRIPVSRLVASSLNSGQLYTFEIIPFGDVGTIWRTGNPLSQRNPIDNEPINSYPLVINVQTLRSPFLVGFGSGIRTFIAGYSIRADFAWGIEDYALQKPRIHLSLGKNF